jgi:sugar/nucleoside kinase (ribokinase family)
MLVCTLGDLLLDVVVVPDRQPVPGDDVPARIRVCAGGQAANVAAWVVALGGRARFVGARADGDAGRLAEAELAAHGVEVAGPRARDHGGVVVSLVDAGGQRTMASDRGAATALRPDDLDPAWLRCDHLHVSGYALAVEPMRTAAKTAIEHARSAGARVSVDLAAATVIENVGRETLRALLTEIRPDAVFCNEDEDRAIGGRVRDAVWILKLGARGASVDGTVHGAAPAGAIVDSTGAGDAFAAGWIVAGIELALAAAARCVAEIGAFPASV